MAADDNESRTEKPTEKKLAEARRKDPPPQSRDLTATVTLLVDMFVLLATAPLIVSTIKSCTRQILGDMGTFQVTPEGVHVLIMHLVARIAVALAPLMIAVVSVAIAVNYVQGGIVLSGEKLTVRFDKLNPLQGAQRLFNSEALVEALKAFLKIALISFLVYRVMRGEVDELAQLGEEDTEEIVAYGGRLVMRIVTNSCGALLVLALLDLGLVKWRYYKKMMMTKEEVKQEHKEADGDPLLKGKIRRMQMERARRRLRHIIPTADVVITNPTHFAIALKYDRERMSAPVVIAKGADHVAMSIKEIARENQVMLVENRFLARELYANVKEGEEIPESLYAAVAEVLAYVFSLRGKI